MSVESSEIPGDSGMYLHYLFSQIKPVIKQKLGLKYRLTHRCMT